MFNIPCSAIVPGQPDDLVLGFIRVTFETKTFRVRITDLRNEYEGLLKISMSSCYINWDDNREPDEGAVSRLVARYCAEEVFRD